MAEIAGSKARVEDNTSLACLMFCPPNGKHSGRHLETVRKAGYLVYAASNWFRSTSHG
jgi:peptidoglycan-N-acetylglucosamine deacetylase